MKLETEGRIKNKYGDLFVRESKEFNENFESVEK